MDSSVINEIFENIVKVRAERQYWLVRTMGGDFFQEYVSRGYVAIGYNEVSLSEIKFAVSGGKQASEILKQIFDSNESLIKCEGDDETNTQYATNQLLKFYRDINVGDILVMPGRSSDVVAIAVVQSEVYEEQNVSRLEGICNFIKRRRIKVLKTTFRSKLNPALQLMFNSRHIVSNANNYAPYIDNCISDFFQKDGYTNLVLRVKEENDIRASDFGVVADLIDLVDEFARYNNLQINVDDIKAKMCVQSPGDILMFAQSWEGITLIGLFILLLKGGELSYNQTDGFKIRVVNLLEALSDFMDRRRDREFKKTMQKKLENMQIETPEELMKIMKEHNDKRKPY